MMEEVPVRRDDSNGRLIASASSAHSPALYSQIPFAPEPVPTAASAEQFWRPLHAVASPFVVHLHVGSASLAHSKESSPQALLSWGGRYVKRTPIAVPLRNIG